jgi:hypothetical protein
MVQLSVLLCLIPLTLENAMMQAHVTQVWHNACLSQRLSLGLHAGRYTACGCAYAASKLQVQPASKCKWHLHLLGKPQASCMTHSRVWC